MNIEEMKFNPFTKIGKEWALVSSGNAEKSNTMTVSWGGVGVLWGKNVVYIFIRESRYTKEFIDSCDTFSLAFLDEKYRDALKYCGANSGRGVDDKWTAAGLTAALKDGVVYPAEAKEVFICRKMAAIPMPADTFIDPEIEGKWYGDHDMHTMYVGEILEVIG